MIKLDHLSRLWIDHALPACKAESFFPQDFPSQDILGTNGHPGIGDNTKNLQMDTVWVRANAKSTHPPKGDGFQSLTYLSKLFNLK